MVKPIFEIFRPIPPIAWIPLAILWFGIDETPKIFICFIGAFVPAVMNAYTGIRFTEPMLLDAARMLGGNRRQLFTEVAIPSAMPAIFAGSAERPESQLDVRAGGGNGWRTGGDRLPHPARHGYEQSRP